LPYQIKAHCPRANSKRKKPELGTPKTREGRLRKDSELLVSIAPTPTLKKDWVRRRGPKKRTRYRLKRYKLERNQVNCNRPKAKSRILPDWPRIPWLNRPLTCQQKAPGKMVKFATAVAKPACSTQVRGWPATIRKSETPECRRI